MKVEDSDRGKDGDDHDISALVSLLQIQTDPLIPAE